MDKEDKYLRYEVGDDIKNLWLGCLDPPQLLAERDGWWSHGH